MAKPVVLIYHVFISKLVSYYAITTELKNMEWNFPVSPLQADGKICVHDVLFLTLISLVLDFHYSLPV